MTDRRCTKCGNMFRYHGTDLMWECSKCHEPKKSDDSGIIAGLTIPVEAVDTGVSVIETIGDAVGGIASVFDGL